MHEVGHHLQIEALKRSDRERDIFARSAYNRYYYSLFLMSREMLISLYPEKDALPHKSYPGILTGQLVKLLKSEKKKAVKNEDYRLINAIESAISAANNFANLIESAYAVRVVADYKPDIKVNFSGEDRFDLQGMQITSAHNWLDRAKLWKDSILYAWKQIHV